MPCACSPPVHLLLGPLDAAGSLRLVRGGAGSSAVVQHKHHLSRVAMKYLKISEFMVHKVICFYVIITQHICSSENKLFFPHEKINCFSISENNFSS